MVGGGVSERFDKLAKNPNLNKKKIFFFFFFGGGGGLG